MTREKAERGRAVPGALARPVANGPYAAFLAEVDAIRTLLLADVHRRSRSEPARGVRPARQWGPVLWFLMVKVLGWGAAFRGVARNLDWVVGGVGVALLTVLVWTGVSVRQFRADYQRRREDSLGAATRAARAHDALVARLMVFGRASLNFVADELRDREARVARRTGLVVGPAQAGGILGLIGLGIAASSTLNRTFTDNGVLSRPVQELTWLVLLVILSRSVTALLIRHNSSALLNYADILHRVSSAKLSLHTGSAEPDNQPEDEMAAQAADHGCEAEIETDEWATEDRELQAQAQVVRQIDKP